MKTKPFDPSRPVIVSTPISTGPRTEIGKEISSRNATKHGCCSTETLILPSEHLDEFKSLENTWFRAYEPREAAEIHLVRQLIQADWFRQRATRTVAEVEARIFASVPDAADWTDIQHQSLSRFLRYETTRANAAAKCRKAIEDYRKNRASEIGKAQDLKHKDEKLQIAKVKLDIYKEKNKPPKSWSEEIAEMKLEAEKLGFRKPVRLD